MNGQYVIVVLVMLELYKYRRAAVSSFGHEIVRHFAVIVDLNSLLLVDNLDCAVFSILHNFH